MRKPGFFCCIVSILLGPESAYAADLPPKMNCKVNGHAGCDGDVCAGGGSEDPSIKLTISSATYTLVLNGIEGTIDDGKGDPYAVGNHTIAWRWGLIAYQGYRLNQPQPGRVFLTLNRGDGELEFLCLGSLKAKP